MTDGVRTSSGLEHAAALTIDSAFDSFARSLPDALCGSAARLANDLQLGSIYEPWSTVFDHPFVLAAPCFAAETMDSLSRDEVRNAVTAHMLGVIESVAIERTGIGRVAMTEELRQILARARTTADEAIARIRVPATAPETQLDLARSRLEQTLLTERTILLENEVDFDRYDRIAAGKAALWLPAPLALAHAAGWSDAERKILRNMVVHVATALRAYEDAVEWEGDEAFGVGWASRLADAFSRVNKKRGAGVANRVLASGVLEAFVLRAQRNFEAATQLASILGMKQTAAWLTLQAMTMAEIRQAEADYAGYAARAKALRRWADRVLT